MKIFLINCVYEYGSTGKIMKDLYTIFTQKGHDTYVLYGRGPKQDDPNIIKFSSEFESKVHSFLSRCFGIMYGYSFFATKRLINLIKREKPDVVNLHCINANCVNIYKLVTWLKKHSINTVITNHAEFYYTANCGHSLECNRYLSGCGSCPRLKKETKSFLIDGTHKSWVKMDNAFSGFEDLFVTSVSPWVESRSSGSAILRDKKHFVVLNGLDTSVFHYYDDCNFDQNNTKTVFHATANFSDRESDIKGGRWLILLAKRMPDVNFVVAGKFEDGLTVPDNMTLLGVLKDQNDLAKWYSKSDLVVLTSKKETFSMVTAESLCCGTPVVGFEAGAPETIAIPEFCKFVPQGDIDALEQSIKDFLDVKFDKRTISDSAIAKYSKEQMGKEYLKVFSMFK